MNHVFRLSTTAGLNQSGSLPIVYVKEPITWEYERVVRNLSQEEPLDVAELNQLGEAGWELTAVCTDSPFAYYYFKRVVA